MKKIIIFTALAAILSLFSACATVKSIPENLTAAQIIQMGQNAVEVYDYKSAEYCYKTVIQRYGTNPATYVEAKYELGNVYYKSKEYQAAYDAFAEILELYDYANGALPGAYKKLASIGMGKLPEGKFTPKE